MARILAIDDEQSCLEIINFSLTSRGFEVVQVSSGLEAIEFLSSNNTQIDLILLDLMMPGMNGKETLLKIRDIESCKYIPVVFQTGASDFGIEKNNTKALEYYIRKPYKRDELVEVIKNALLVEVA